MQTLTDVAEIGFDAFAAPTEKLDHSDGRHGHSSVGRGDRS
jgi:hypothetical protein